MKAIGTFPFGQPVQEVVQKDRTPKDVFVLGVYASAVHAQWIGLDERPKVRALAVASEPYIFWRGENAEAIIKQVTIPKELGKLIPAEEKFNGPSGRALEDLILKPLGFIDRQHVWLCDLVPHSCVNISQSKAIKREYSIVVPEYGLAKHSVPPVPLRLSDENRRNAILDEIKESETKILILLGDQPIKWFLASFENRWSKLSDFGRDIQSYGQLHDTELGGKKIKILPLAHPRQIAKLGQSSSIWYDVHAAWIERSSSQIAHNIKTG